MSPTTSCLQLAFRDAPPGEIAIRAALEVAQRVLERSGILLRKALAAYQAFASGAESLDTFALTFA